MKISMMKLALLPLVCATIAVASFTPNVRVDREDDPDRGCSRAAITLGPGTGSSQPVYVVFEDRLLMVDVNIMFQRSTDAGRTWLPADVLVGPACNPDITTDPDGNIYVVHFNGDPNVVRCSRSTDGGVTWSSPTEVMDTRTTVGGARIVADSAGNLFCAWNDWRTGGGCIWSSVSTDRGETWSRNVRVDEDTTVWDCYQPDVFVQPGTNHYLVAAEVPRPDGPISCYLYRSTDMGQSFQSGVLVDTFGGSAFGPHVVADAHHVICDYTDSWCNTEARTLYTEPDTWGVPHSVGTSNANGPQLAISADGRLHTALLPSREDTYYAFSSDHGVSWSDPERANDDTITATYDPDIAADSAGHAYIVWRKGSIQHGEIWFATNNPAAIAEQPTQQPISAQPLATVVRSVLLLSERPSASTSALLDISGRKVMDLKPGANDVRALAPGVYFVRSGPSAVSREPSAVTKVVVTR